MFVPLPVDRRVLALLVLSLGVRSASTGTRLHGHTTDAAAFAKLPFDYIVVGGGTAGLTVAARLSEKPSLRVGVIEAGDLHLQEPLIDTPINYGSAIANPEFDWFFLTAPQRNALNNVLPISRGKLLGGSSGLNFLLFHRASAPEYDSWSRILGMPNTWDFKGLLPFFKKAETLTPGPGGVFPGLPNPPGTNDNFEGRRGPIHPSFNNFYTDVDGPFVQTLLNLGVPVNAEPDGGNATGTFNCPRAVDVATGNRSYSMNGYFLPNQNRQNLLVLTGAQATQITFDKPQKDTKLHANGVKFVSGGQAFSVSVAKEVILSAGSIQTPQLLELSGIGNATLLKSVGVSPIIDLPFVGENLQDHLAIPTTFFVKNESILTSSTRIFNLTFREEQFALYQNEHRGVFTYTAPGLSFNPLHTFFDQSTVANLTTQLEKELKEASLSPFHRAQANEQLRLLKEGKVAQTEIIFNAGTNGVIPDVPPPNIVTLFGFGSRPFSRGSVHINTTDPLVQPIIDPNFMQFSFDRQIMVETIKFLQKAAASEPLQSFLSGPMSPTSNVTDLETFFLQNFSTEFHPVGTASLGPAGAGGVVGPDLIVYGTANIRVVDASIIPIHIAAHPQATVYAIGEKAASIILGK